MTTVAVLLALLSLLLSVFSTRILKNIYNLSHFWNLKNPKYEMRRTKLHFHVQTGNSLRN